MNPFDLAPELLAPSRMWPSGNRSHIDALCGGLLNEFRNGISREIGDNQFNIRYLRALTYLIPYITGNLDTRGMRALEVGSGHGAKSIALSHIFKDYVGLEIVPDLSDFSIKAKKNFGCDNLRFVVDEAANLRNFLEQQEEKFDFIILYAVLEHLTIEEKLETIGACWDHLDDNGYLFIGETPNRMLPLDLHSTKLFYYQQMPIDLMPYCFNQSINRNWAKIMEESIHNNNFKKTAYRRGIHIGHQELEIPLFPIDQMRSYLVDDNFSPAMLNQYAFLDLEFLKAMEMNAIRGYSDRSDIESKDFPSVFSRYFFELLLRKGGVTRKLMDVIIVKPTLKTREVSSLHNSETLKIFRKDSYILENPGDAAEHEISVEIRYPAQSGTFKVTSSSGQILGSFNPRTLVSGISKSRQRFVFSLGTVRSEQFPLVFNANSSKPVFLNYIFCRPVGKIPD